MTALPIQIEPLTQDDYPHASEIVAQSVRALWCDDYNDAVIETVAVQNEPEWILKRSENQADYLARHDGRPVGYAAVKKNEIGHLFVRPDATRQGVGSTLVTFCCGLIGKNGFDTAKVYASLSAVEFYQKQGFRQTGEQSFEFAPGAVLDAILMEKDL
jgi:putative acetyltransferase